MTMYRLMLWYLRFLIAAAIVLSFFHILPYSWLDILITAAYLVVVCYLANQVFCRVFKTKANPESQIITAQILILIFGPLELVPNIGLLTFIGVAAMASKYILRVRGRHIFNPAAFGAVAAALVLREPASWWVGSIEMLPFVAIGGLVMLKKIRRFKLAGIFLLVSLVLSMNPETLWHSPLLFFALVMLVEPLTEPSRDRYRIYYGILIAVLLFAYQRIFNVPYILELALLSGNLVFRLIEKNPRRVLKLVKKEPVDHNQIGFWFEAVPRPVFAAGQFMEWMLPHPHPDSRGIRHFFTIASSPTEKQVLLATKFYDKPSTFKQALRKLTPGKEIYATLLSGDFTLPKDPSRKLAFIAGGIGITPFRSMIKYLLDKNEKRNIILFYSNKTAEDIAFKELFDQAQKVGVRAVYFNTETNGYITPEKIKKDASDFQERLFYVSGPEPMVEAFEKMLAQMGISKKNIKRDYFPGYTETHTG